MSQPKILVQSAWRDAIMEVSTVYVLTTIGAVHLLSLHWLFAMLLAPFLMGAGLLTVTVMVQLLWAATVGLDRLGSALGLRKSPLA
jgi:hypothetical protein